MWHEMIVCLIFGFIIGALSVLIFHFIEMVKGWDE